VFRGHTGFGLRFIQISNLKFDVRTRQASIDDRPQVLSSREAAVLELLMLSKESIVPKRLVEKKIFGPAAQVASNAIEVSMFTAFEGSSLTKAQMRGLRPYAGWVMS